jgi:hypothetical protein
LSALISTYIFVSIFFIWGWDGTHGDRDAIGQSFSFFTWLTYWGLGFYTLFAAIHTALYARTGRSVLFDRWPRTLRAMHGILYTTITVYPPLVTLVFWIILFKPPFYKETFTGWSNVRFFFLLLHLLFSLSLISSIHAALWQPCGSPVMGLPCARRDGLSVSLDCNTPPATPPTFQSFELKTALMRNMVSQISQHGLNSLYAILEITLPTTAPHPWIYIPFLILFLLLYLCVAYITVHTEGFYAYSFLDIQANGSPLVTGYCFGILAAILVIFLVTWGLIWLRGWLVKGRIKRSTRDPLYGQDRCHGLEAGDQVGKVEPCEMKHVQV